MPIAETALIIKGGIAIAQWLAAHGTNAMALKGGAIIAKGITTQGLASTLAGVTGLAVSSSLVVGGYLWTTERIELVGKGLQGLLDGDVDKMTTNFAKLALKLDIDFDVLPDALEDLLYDKFDYSYESAHYVAQIVQSYEKEISREMNKKRK